MYWMACKLIQLSEGNPKARSNPPRDQEPVSSGRRLSAVVEKKLHHAVLSEAPKGVGEVR